MPFNQAGEQVSARLPVCVDLQCRQSQTLRTDPYMENCFIEKEQKGDGNTKLMAVKRPGLTSAFTYNSGGATNGQGMVMYKGLFFAMGSNTLYLVNGTVAGSSTLGAAVWSQTGITATAPWVARTGAMGVVAFNRMWMFGGAATTGTKYNDVWSSVDGVTWVQEASAAPWPARSFGAVQFFNDRFYIFGGLDSGGLFLNDVWSSADGVIWQQETANAGWSARSSFGSVVFNNGMWVMGGVGASGRRNDVWYSTDGITWVAMVLNASWSARSSFGCQVFLNRIYVVGGFDGAVNDTVYYTADGITWTQATAAAFGGGYQGNTCFVYQNKLWSVAGLDGGGSSTDDVWSTPDGVNWTLVTNAPGWGARASPVVLIFPTPVGVSTIRASTAWLFGGSQGASYANDVWYGGLNTNLATSFSTTTTGATTEQWQFNETTLGNYMVGKNTYNMYVFFGGLWQAVTDPDYPARTVPGIVSLNNCIYVMTDVGEIHGSFIEDPFRWASLNFLTAEYKADAGVFLGQMQNYVVAFGATTIQFFYQPPDAGPDGSPLRPVQNATMQLGCASAGSVAQLDTALVFMGRSEQQGIGIYVMQGTSVTKVSTPSIDRLLNQSIGASTTFNATCIDIGGHNFYLLSCAGLGVTLAWDSVDKGWAFWTDLGAGNFRAINYATDGVINYMQHRTLGIVYAVLPNVYADGTDAITCRMQGEIVDFGGNQPKFPTSLTVIGDRRASASPNTLTIYWYNDDYQTQQGGRTVDLTAARPMLTRLGRFLRRAFLLQHVSSTNPMRIEALELAVEPGDMQP